MTQIQSLRTTLQLLNCFLTWDSDDQIQSFVILACIKNKKTTGCLHQFSMINEIVEDWVHGEVSFP